MFLFVLAKLLPERHNLYGNSLDFKLKYMREKKKIDETWAWDENTFLVKYQDGDTDDTLQAKYQAKVDELAKMRRSASPDAAKAELIFQKNQNI